MEKGLEHTRLFVGGMPESITDGDLKMIFDMYGQVEAATLLQAKGSRRCGFVNYTTWGEALDAVENLDGQSFPNSMNGEVMSVSIAAPREGGGGNGTKYRKLDSAGGYAHGGGGGGADPTFEDLKQEYLT